MRLLTFVSQCCAAIAFLSALQANAVPMPSPISRRSPVEQHVAPAMATPIVRRSPVELLGDRSPDDIFAFYKPRAGHLPTPIKRSDVPSVPLSQLGPPSFPAQYPSCYNCQQKYSSLSSCMQASAVFQNATSIFNDPVAYFNVIKCACTDTFQAVYPQCVECFQMTDQCYYLGTDPQGTGAPTIVTNMRQICAFGSSLLGGAESANYPTYNNTVTLSVVPAYTDVTQTGVGYQDQSTGALFGAARRNAPSAMQTLPLLVLAITAGVSALCL